MFADRRDLNERQREAAAFGDGPLRVLAGPGTGKTTTLTARVQFLLERGVAPERVLLVTFTRRAAREIIGRVRALAENEGARRVVGGTFHSVGHATLRRHHAALGLPEGFGVLDRGDAADLMDLIRGELGVVSHERRLPKKTTLASLYSRTVNTGVPLSEVLGEHAPWCADRAEEIATVFNAYVGRKSALGLLDFDDLLLDWRAAVQDDSLGPRLAAAWDHVLVDEFQDVNALQLDVLTGLRRDDRRVTLVGDDAQAVYGFRGASARFLLDADVYFAGLTTISLELNYRSSADILSLANAVATDAPEGFTAVLREAVPVVGASRPRLVHCADERDQSALVADRVLELYEEGIALRDQAVLFRTAHHSDDLEIELARRRIPFVKYGGLRYLEGAHVKDLLAAFRLGDNPRDEMAWFRLLQLLPGVGPTRARRAFDALRDVDGRLPLAHHEVLERWAGASAFLPPGARDLAEGLVAALGARAGEPLPVHAERLRVALAPLIVAAYHNAAARLEDLGALVRASSDASRLSEVAAEQALESPLSTGDLAGPPLVDEDWLVLSTIHSAKGLEFDSVHLLHAADGNIPSDMAVATPEGVEEERRLFYVALTRARRNLAVFLPLRYHHHRGGDAHSWAQPSRFLTAGVRAALEEVSSSEAAVDATGDSEPVVAVSRLVAGRIADLW
jgi:DNA helicase-2/ATP-dependent DNA helicase PcrA